MRETRVERGTSELPGFTTPNGMRPEGGARTSRATSGAHPLMGRETGGCARASMVAPATTLRARCRESCRSAPVTTEEVAEVLVVAGVFWASRLISLIPPGWKQRNVVPPYS